MPDCLERLEKAGVDVKKAVERFGGNAELYLKFLRRFPQDENYSGLCKSLEQHDISALAVHAHTLKGVAANLGMNQLSGFCAEMVRKCRAEETDGLEALGTQVSESYRAVVAAIG